MNENGRLLINLLGKPEVWLDGEQLTSFSTAKTEALLYYLAATSQTHSRETLAGLLWSEMPEAKARRNLTKSLSVLRRLLKPFLIIEPQRVGFDQSIAFELDVTRLESAAAPSPDIIKLYRGDFLEGFFVKDALAFEEWQLTQRERLREMGIDLLETAVQQAIDQQNYATGIGYGRQLLALDPWRESAHRQLMLLLARNDQAAAALAQYEQCQQLLADELGVEPMPETTGLYRRIQQSRTARTYQLPATATPFVGREEELAQIGQRLASSECRLLTLVGLGGMGKTRLALAVAQQVNREQARQFLQGVIYVSLTGVATPELLPTTLADAMDLNLNGRQDPTTQLGHFLRDKEMLLVLDNFEHLLKTPHSTNILTRLLQAAPDIKFLITSRQPLQIEAEHRFDVAGLPFPVNSIQYPANNGSLITDNRSPITNYPAVQLFLQTARQVRSQFDLTPENEADVIHICRMLSGIPLAIKLAAAWLRILDCAEIVVEIERGLDLLATTMRDLPPRQRSMTAVFDHSWQMLTKTEQTSLAALSVFQDGFTVRAAREVVGVSLPVLAGLVDRALLHLHKTPNGSRYHLHELTRQYAAEKLGQNTEAASAIRTAHTNYYAQQMAALTPQMSGEAPQEAYADIHQEIGNVRQAWQQAIDQLNLDSLRQMLEPLYHFYSRQGWITEGQERLATAVSAIQNGGRDDKTAVQLMSGLLARQGALIGRVGKYEAAETALRQSSELARKVADPHQLAFALLELGAVLRDQSRFAEAAEMFQECFDIATELNGRHLIARATEKLGVITWDQGSHRQAQEKLNEALSLFRELKDARRTANALNSLGNVLMSAGSHQEALAHYQEALPIVRRLKNWLLLDTVLINLGMISNELGDQTQSRRYYEESLAICRRIGDEIGVAYCLTGLGQANMGEGDLATARDFFEQGLALNREMGRDRYVGINLDLLGDVNVLEEKWSAARAHYEESLAVCAKIEHPWGVASSHLRLGDLEIAQGNETAATDHYQAALSLGQKIEAQGIVLTALINLATILLGQADGDDVETAVFVLKTVLKQPSISDSQRQAITALLAQHDRVQEEVSEAGLATAVAKILQQK